MDSDAIIVDELHVFQKPYVFRQIRTYHQVHLYSTHANLTLRAVVNSVMEFPGMMEVYQGAPH